LAGPALQPFPSAVAVPGSVGDAEYTPLVRIANAGGQIYNAPVIAFDKSAAEIGACAGNVDHSLVHDRVLKICPAANGGGTVTIKLTTIFRFGRPAQYMSTEASDPMVATLDRGTFTPAMNDLGLPLAIDRRVPADGVRATRIHHRSRGRALRLGRHPRQLPARAPVPVTAASGGERGSAGDRRRSRRLAPDS